MKSKILFSILLFSLFGCEKDKIDETPDNMTSVRLCEALVDTLSVLLPPGCDAFVSHPELFSNVQKNINIKENSKVYVTFIDEGAAFKNSLFWYSYDKNKVPAQISDIQGNIVFPNISKVGEGGLLEPGFTVQLGTDKFPAGTVIGFYLVVNGWKNGVIDLNNTTHYTDYKFNLESKQQHVLFKDLYSKYVIVGFEDLTVSGNNNGDYNDIFFAVSDNEKGYEAKAFDLTNVVIK